MERNYHRSGEFYFVIPAFGHRPFYFTSSYRRLVSFGLHVVVILWIVGHIFMDSGSNWITSTESDYVFHTPIIFVNRFLLCKLGETKTERLGALFLFLYSPR